MKHATLVLSFPGGRTSELVGASLQALRNGEMGVQSRLFSEVKKEILLLTCMNYWIFQSVVEKQDLRETLQEQKEDTRLASRYRQQMSPGDLVYFWLAGDEGIRGIYGWGELQSAPYLTKDGQQFRVKVRYLKRLRSRLPAGKISATAPLQELMIFRAPQATNFLLTREEAQAIADLMTPGERPQI